MRKNILHKVTFILLLIGILLPNLGVISISTNQKVVSSTLVKGKKEKSFSDVKVICETETDSDCFFEEFELENDFEFDSFSCNSNAGDFTSSLTENQKLHNKTTFYLIQAAIPLYDMFCNWKHHLS